MLIWICASMFFIAASSFWIMSSGRHEVESRLERGLEWRDADDIPLISYRSESEREWGSKKKKKKYRKKESMQIAGVTKHRRRQRLREEREVKSSSIVPLASVGHVKVVEMARGWRHPMAQKKSLARDHSWIATELQI